MQCEVVAPEVEGGGVDDEEENEFDLGESAEEILAGGTMSILRRKGKKFRDPRRRDREAKQPAGRGAKQMAELLSSDIQTLLSVFHDEAASKQVSIASVRDALD